MLHLSYLHPSPEKVFCAESHPVQPWIACATKSNHVSVWDRTNGTTVFEVQLGGGSDEFLQDQDLARLHAKDPIFQSNHSLQTPSSVTRTVTGNVKAVHFLDTEVAQAQLTAQHYQVSGSGNPPPRADNITSLQGQRLLVIVCEMKVLIYDLISHKSQEITKTLLEGKAATCASFLFQGGIIAPSRSSWVMTSPLIAIGCSDGLVRLIQLHPLKPVARLLSGHKSGIVTITTVAVRGQQWEAVVAGHASGGLVAWEPLAKAIASAGVPTTKDTKIHDKEVVGIQHVVLGEDPETPHRMLFTAGLDNKVYGYDINTFKEAAKVKIDAKVQLTAFAYCPRGYVSSGAHVLLAGTDAGVILSVHPASGSIRLVCDLSKFIPSGHKKAPKVYGLAVHPLQPQFVLAATNVGTAVLSLEAIPPLPVIPLPLLAPSQALPDSASLGFGEAAGSGATFVSTVGDTVTCVSCSSIQQAGEENLRRGPGVQLMGKLNISSGKPLGRALLSASFDGSYVSVVWPAARSYAIYRQGMDSWHEVVHGAAASIAWHATRHLFAIIEQPMPAAAPPPPKKESRGWGSKAAKEKEAEAARAAAEAAAQLAASAVVTLQIKELKANSVTSSKTMHTGADTPVFVNSGPLLGIVFKRDAPGGTELVAGEPPAVLQLHNWDTQMKVGPELAEPQVMAWDPSMQFCALAYSAQILLCAVQPTFQVMSTLAIPGVTGLEWAMRQLYIATPTHIYCAFLSTQPPLALPSAPSSASPAPPACPVITLATFSSSSSTGGGGTAVKLQPWDTLVPSPAVRPPGPLSLLGPRAGALWVVNAHGQPVPISLTHPGYRLCSMIAAGDLQGVSALAQQAIPPYLHDEVCQFLLAMEGMRGLMVALSLPGISLATEARLRVLARHWPQAVEACEALLAGFKTKPAPGEFTSVAAAAAFGSTSSRTGPLSDAFADMASVGPARSVSGLAHPEDLDWSLPLRQAGSLATAKQPAVTPVSAGSKAHVQAAADISLQLLSGLVLAGMLDVAEHMGKALMKYAGELSDSQRSQLASLLAQAGLKTELGQLAQRQLPAAASQEQEAAGLLAAALSGHTGLVQDILKQCDSPALAAMQAAAFTLNSTAASQSLWKQQLQSSSLGSAGRSQGLAQLSLAAQ